MIPENFVIQWRKNAPWQTLAMVEQDLVISKALIDLYNHSHIQESLIFRGGTALNKLYIDPPARYSEDIDFVQTKTEPIGKTIDAIRECLDSWLGEPKRKHTERSTKLIYRYNAVDNTPAKLKVEINTTEHFKALPLKSINYSIESEWFAGKTNIITYEIDELIATKLRALYQRNKGRDLFDLWLVLKNKLIAPAKVAEIFHKYADYNKELISRAMFEKNIFEKEQYIDFALDMNLLLSPTIDWSIEEAFDLVKNELLACLAGERWRRDKNIKHNLT
jgi:predicted nucleotidyltransferase component of viral defense system